MRRVRYESMGGPLFLEEAPVPEPGPGELLVRCEAVGVTLPVVRKVTEAAEPVPLGGEPRRCGAGRRRRGHPLPTR